MKNIFSILKVFFLKSYFLFFLFFIYASFFPGLSAAGPLVSNRDNKPGASRISQIFKNIKNSQGSIADPKESKEEVPSSQGFLTIKDALKMGIENNFDLKIRDIEVDISKEQLKSIRADFKPSLRLNYEISSLEKLQNSIDFSSTSGIRNWKENNWKAETAVTGKTRTGTAYSLSYNVNSYDNSLNRQAPSLNALFNPEVDTFTGITINHPLLRNSGRKVNLAPEKIGKIEINIKDYEKRTYLNNLVLNIADSFYDLVFAAENIAVKRKSLEIANKFLALAARRHELGKADKIDVYQARIQVSEADERVLSAQDNYRKARTGLLKKTFAKTGPSQEFPEYVFASLVKPETERMDFSLLYDLALENRPDYLAALKELKKSGLRHDYSVKQILPQLDVSFSYGFSGLGRSVSNSNQIMDEWDNPAWSAGFSYSMPLGGFVREKAEEKIYRARKNQQEINIEKLLAHIQIEIRSSIERLGISEKRYESSRFSRITAEKALETEEQRYLKGRTSSYSVLELQNKLFSAKTRELASLVDLYKSIDEIWAVTGRITRRYGFSSQE
jgi:outer membrane protein TolC